jgi:hypothetical protein
MISYFSCCNDSVRQIWVLPFRGQDKNEGYILISLTYNETKVFRWRSPTSRGDGVPWSGELDIDDITDRVADDLSISEETLAAGISDGDIFQITPTGIYSAKFRRQSTHGRLIKASIMGGHLAFVTYTHEPELWNSWSTSFEELVRDESRPNQANPDIVGSSTVPQDDFPAKISSESGNENLKEEPTALKLFLCR